MSPLVADVPAASEHPGARWRPSPNYGTRYHGKTIDAIVLHYTGMQNGEGAEDWLCDPTSGVSSHYLVHEDGEIVQMVREIDRAWHAGIGCWHGERDMNSVSIGIEIVNAGHRDWDDDADTGPLPAFPKEQIASVIALCLGAMRRWSIAGDRVLGHSDLAPHRKRDPGEAFPWDQLCDEGIGICIDPTPVGEGEQLPVMTMQTMLRDIGFDIAPSGEFCPHTEMTVRAFQRHWRRERVDGVADGSTCDTIRRLHAECAGSQR